MDAAISGGLFVGLGDAIIMAFELAASSAGGQAGQVLGILGPVISGGMLGLMSILIFPIHWLLTYRPDNVLYALAIMLPWILTGSLSALIFAKSSKEGFFLPLITGILAAGVGVGLFAGIGALSSQPGIGIAAGIIDGIFNGLTDLGPIPATLTATLEGAFIGSVFGAFIGALKYKPSKEEYQPKRGKKEKKQKPPKTYESFGGSAKVTEPTFQTTTKSDDRKCKYCGAALPPGSSFCTNCGNKV